MVQKIHPWGVIGVPNSGPYVKKFQIQELLSKCSILEPSLTQVTYLRQQRNLKLHKQNDLSTFMAQQLLTTPEKLSSTTIPPTKLPHCLRTAATIDSLRVYQQIFLWSKSRKNPCPKSEAKHKSKQISMGFLRQGKKRIRFLLVFCCFTTN